MQLRLEHLEQGFSVYVNGANSELKASPRKAIHSNFSRSASHTEGTHGEHRNARSAPALLTNEGQWNHIPCTETSQPVQVNSLHLARKRQHGSERQREREIFFFNFFFKLVLVSTSAGQR